MYKKLFFSVIFFSLIFQSCHKYKENAIGPNIGIASNDFALVSEFTVSTNSVNFKTTPSVNFNAEFNEEVSYTILIKGENTGAIKTISGLSKLIDLNNASWSGEGDFVFFGKEKCIAELKVLGKDGIVSSAEVTIEEPMKGTFIANFENFSLTANVGFWEPDQRIYCGKSDTAFEGSKAYKMEGIDTKGGGFIGLSYTNPATGFNAYYNKNGYSLGPGKAYYNYEGLTQPDSLWFNIFIYGTGDPNLSLYIKFKQDDNVDGNYIDATENGYEWPLTDLSHTGWKLFSVNYSTLLVSGNQAYGGGGDKVHRPNYISSIEYGLWSKKKDGQVSIIYDYPVFTFGKPFGK